MTCFRLAWRWAMLCSLGLIACGCFPAGDSPMVEEKEPHFMRGREYARAMDFKAAVEEYEAALKANPNHSLAHYELGYLFEDKPTVADPAAAIYHYERFLKLQPRSDKAETIRGRINGCKVELAKTVSAVLVTPLSVQRDYEKVLAENRDLKARLSQWQAYYAVHPRPPAATNSIVPVPVPTAVSNAVRPVPATAPAITGSRAGAANPLPVYTPTNRTATASAPRTHTVRPGDSPYLIAKKYGVSLPALLAANPQVRPTHLQPGQTLNIPASP